MNYRKLIAAFIFAFVLAGMLYLAISAVVPDTLWCIDNYPVDRIAHCLHYENTVYGRFIQP